MTLGRQRLGRRRPFRRLRRGADDAGFGLLEVLVAVVLLGLGAAGTLTGISISIRGSHEAASLTGARRWLVSAADYVVSDNVARVPCTSGEAAVRAAYQSAAQSLTSAIPAGWPASLITVVPSVTFFNGSTFGSTCYEANGLTLQMFTLRTQSPDGKEVETVTVVKRDG
jgi:prepilin-type N-terminal cleavage/methylation domain-containing protein